MLAIGKHRLTEFAGPLHFSMLLKKHILVIAVVQNLQIFKKPSRFRRLKPEIGALIFQKYDTQQRFWTHEHLSLSGCGADTVSSGTPTRLQSVRHFDSNPALRQLLVYDCVRAFSTSQNAE